MAQITQDFSANAAKAEGRPAPEREDIQAFMSAGSSGDIPAMKKFVKKFPGYIDAGRSAGDYNTLMWSSKAGKISSIDFLAENGANVDVTDSTMETPLQLAAWMGRTGAVLALLLHGADYNAPGRDGLNAADRAREHGHPEIAALIDQFARGEHLDTLKSLKEQLLEEELKIAAAEAEAKIDRRTVPEWKDFSDFYSAATGGNIDGMRKFLKQFGRQYIDVSRDGEGGFNALMWVGKHGAIESIRFLVDNGADVNYADRNGETPLMVAAWLGRNDAVRSLLLRGADYTAKDNKGRTAAAWALEHNHPETAQVIEKFRLDEIEYELQRLKTGTKKEISIETAQFRPRPKSATLKR